MRFGLDLEVADSGQGSGGSGAGEEGAAPVPVEQRRRRELAQAETCPSRWITSGCQHGHVSRLDGRLSR